MISEDKMSVARAGEILGLGRISAINWYTSHGFYYPDLSEKDLADELRHARKPWKPEDRTRVGSPGASTPLAGR